MTDDAVADRDQGQQPRPATTDTSDEPRDRDAPAKADPDATPSGGKGFRARLPRFLRVVELGAVLGLVGSGFTLWYQAVYVPSTLPATLSVSVELSPMRFGPAAEGMGDISEFEAIINVTNASNRRVTVIAAQYSLWGIDIDRRSDNGAAEMIGEQGRCGTAIGGRYIRATARAPELIATGRFLDGAWFDPGQDYAERRLFFIKPDDFDMAELTVDLYFAKGDLVTQTEPRPIAWDPQELDGNTGNYCRLDLAGDLTVPPLYVTSWQVRNRTPLVGGLIGDPRRLAVEWRPAAIVGQGATSGAPCDPFAGATTATEPCLPSTRLGPTTAAQYIQPVVVYCREARAVDSCDLLLTTSLEDGLRLAEELGLAVTRSTTDLVLWP